MPDEVPMVTSCTLCLAADEVSSMVTVEIDRRIGGGRTAIMICRSCAGAVIRAARHADPELLDLVLNEREQAAIVAAMRESSLNAATRAAAEEYLEGMGESVELHDGEDSDDGKTTD